MIRLTLVDRLAYAITIDDAIIEDAWLKQIQNDGYQVHRKYLQIPGGDDTYFKIRCFVEFDCGREAAIFKLTYL